MAQTRIARILGSAAAALLLFIAASASAAEYPTRAVRVICPFPAGGTADIMARLVAQQLQEASSHPVVVENRPGAAGNIGADLVAKAEPDGHTLLVSPPPPLAVNISLYQNLPFDSRKDFAYVTVVAQSPSVLVVHPRTPYKSVAELVAYAKANPGQVNYASQGNGTTSHLTAALLNKAAAVSIAHVPYRGSAPALTDLLAGQVDIMFDNLGSSLGHIRSGALRALAVGSTERADGLRDVPTMIEAGYPGFVSVAWFGVAAPARTPADIVKFVSDQVAKGLKKPDVKERLAGIGVYPVGSTPQEMTKFVQEETARWRDVIQAAGVKLE